MSSISKAGIFIDIKDLLEYTDGMVKEMKNADRVNYGDELKRLNIAMIVDFTMAYHRRDEHISFTAGGKSYDINLKGEKRNLVDKLEADFDAYQALMEMCWEKNKFSRLKRRTFARAMSVTKSRQRGRRNYMDAINSYLGLIKATSDRYKAVQLLDAVKRKGFIKNYKELKLQTA